jgi:hypothetical protein
MSKTIKFVLQDTLVPPDKQFVLDAVPGMPFRIADVKQDNQDTEIKALLSRFSHHITITHAMLTEAVANTAQVIELVAVGDQVSVRDAAIKVVTEFADADDAAFNSTTVTVGDGGDADRFVESAQVNANGTAVAKKAGTAAAMAGYTYTTTDTIDITFNSMAAKALVDLDSGEILILLDIEDPGDES